MDICCVKGRKRLFLSLIHIFKYASMQRVVILLIFYGGLVAEMSDLQQTTGLKRHKVGLLAIVGTIYSLTAAGAYGLSLIHISRCYRDVR